MAGRKHVVDDPQASWGAARVIVQSADDAPANLQAARQLAEQLSLPLAQGQAGDCDLALTVTGRRVELRSLRPGGPGPVYAEFVGGAMGYDRRIGGSRLLLKAIGPRAKSLHVVDATAGLGQDAFLMAWAGCRVTAVERSPVIATLLEDGLRRSLQVARLAEKLDGRLRLIVEDARQFLSRLGADEAPEVIYLDPMYPPRHKSAAGRKEMSVLRQVAGNDDDAGELFKVAHAVAGHKVVVKRMLHAPPVAPGPTRVYKGKSTRYDVYVRTHLRPPAATNPSVPIVPAIPPAIQPKKRI